jgi:hypothetical protein
MMTKLEQVRPLHDRAAETHEANALREMPPMLNRWRIKAANKRVRGERKRSIVLQDNYPMKSCVFESTYQLSENVRLTELIYNNFNML